MMSEFDYNCLIFRFSPFHVNSNLWYTKKQTHRYGNSDLASSPMLGVTYMTWFCVVLKH